MREVAETPAPVRRLRRRVKDLKEEQDGRPGRVEMPPPEPAAEKPSVETPAPVRRIKRRMGFLKQTRREETPGKGVESVGGSAMDAKPVVSTSKARQMAAMWEEQGGAGMQETAIPASHRHTVTKVPEPQAAATSPVSAARQEVTRMEP